MTSQPEQQFVPEPTDDDASLLGASLFEWEGDEELVAHIGTIVEPNVLGRFVSARTMGFLGIFDAESLESRKEEFEPLFAMYVEALMTGARFANAKQERERAQREEDTSVD